MGLLCKEKKNEEGIRRFEKMFIELGLDAYRIINDETGFWIMILKHTSGEKSDVI